jgi:hypothetical protein
MPQHQTQIIKGESQTGCRTGSSTIDHLFKVNQILQKCWENNININQTYVDFKQAYDSIDHKKLWKIMYDAGIHGNLIRLVGGIMKDAEAQMQVQNHSTE